MRENISKLNPAMLQDALNKVYIPLWTPHLSVDEIAAYSLIGGVSESTAYRWMGKLGFVYSTTRAGYYVDNHEAPAVVEYREKYLARGVAITETRNSYEHIFSCEELGKKIKDQQPAFDISFQNFDALKKLAEQLTPPIPLSETRPLMKEGWVGKPKGLLQILWERGFIDPSKVKDYYMEHDETKRDEEAEPFCLRWLMSRCPDFLEEETQIEYIMKKLGVEIIMSPKCHPELAGEGVEYDWGMSKKYYRKQRSLAGAKVTSAEFTNLVESSLRGGPDVDGSTAPLQMTRVLKFARRAHFYKLAYWALRPGADKTKTICLKDIEDSVKLLKKKTYKKHRGCETNAFLAE